VVTLLLVGVMNRAGAVLALIAVVGAGGIEGELLLQIVVADVMVAAKADLDLLAGRNAHDEARALSQVVEVAIGTEFGGDPRARIAPVVIALEQGLHVLAQPLARELAAQPQARQPTPKVAEHALDLGHRDGVLVGGGIENHLGEAVLELVAPPLVQHYVQLALLGMRGRLDPDLGSAVVEALALQILADARLGFGDVGLQLRGRWQLIAGPEADQAQDVLLVQRKAPELGLDPHLPDALDRMQDDGERNAARSGL